MVCEVNRVSCLCLLDDSCQVSGPDVLQIRLASYHTSATAPCRQIIKSSPCTFNDTSCPAIAKLTCSLLVSMILRPCSGATSRSSTTRSGAYRRAPDVASLQAPSSDGRYAASSHLARPKNRIVQVRSHPKACAWVAQSDGLNLTPPAPSRRSNDNAHSSSIEAGGRCAPGHTCPAFYFSIYCVN